MHQEEKSMVFSITEGGEKHIWFENKEMLFESSAV
jgi:hypothetical protein